MSMPETTSPRPTRLPAILPLVGLAAVLILALILRLWGLNFGLPQRFHVDEPGYVLAALKLASGQLRIDYPLLSPNIHQIILLFEYGLLFVIGRLSGVYPSIAAFSQSYQVDPTPFYILSRLTSVFFSLLTIGLTFLLGRRLVGAWGGVAAALFLAVFLPDVRQAHFGEPYALISFFALASVYSALLYHEQGRMRHLLWSGALAGAALALRFSLAPLVLVPLVAVFTPKIGVRSATARFTRSAVSTRKPAVILPLVYAGLSILSGFVVAYPGVFINPGSLLSALGLYSQAALADKGFEGFIIAPWSSWGFYLRVLVIGVGIPTLAAALAGMVYLFVRRRWEWLLVLVFPFLFLVVLGTSQMFFIRYTVPLMPFLALLADLAVVQAAGLFRKLGPAWPAVTGLALCIVVAFFPLRSDSQHNSLLSAQDTRTQAKDWIEANLPAGAKIAQQWFTPDLVSETDPTNVPGPHYKITVMDPFANGAKLYSLDEYRKKGFEYIVVSSFITGLPRVNPKEEALRQAFYQSLDQQAELLMEYKPATRQGDQPIMILDEIYSPVVSLGERQKPGPDIKIYHIVP